MNASVGDYEVFLSFRGADTRQGFTDILHKYMTMAEIRVFRDDDELVIGDKIDSILEAISNSKICVPIFSPRFAESKWCLREVSRMVELKKKIVPVFYKVTPDDIKLKGTSLYSDDFKKLEESHGNHEEIAKWKNGLREAASNKGRELGGESYTKFCKEFVDEILSKLGPRKRLEIDHFVGVYNKKEAMKLLDMESIEGVICLGLYGMGGIGKTTIAKLIYNDLLSSFDHSSFVPDIREFSKIKGINGLSGYLFDNLQPKSVAPFSWSEQIAERLNKKKVLIVLDDVDSCEQIQEIAKDPSSWFGSGSRIIVTTRDKNVLEEYYIMLQGSRSEVVRYMEMKELECGSAMELFSTYTFGKDLPPSPFQDLSERAIAYAGGLPLAITVIAKYLRNKKEGVWEEIIERLKRTPPKEVKDKLLISYEVLEDEQKKIFLDIACLFIGYQYTETSATFYMWQDCGLCPRWSLEVLQSRSLMKTDEHGRLRMHDQLRDMGRDVVKAKSKEDFTKQSRLWEHREGVKVLKCKKKMKDNIEALRLLNDKSVNDEKNKFTHEGFVSFDKLRILEMGRSTLQGDFSDLLPQMRWFQCRFILEAKNLVLSNLVILDFSHSDINENWDGWSQIQALQKLKILDLSWCQRLGQTPVFTKNMTLQRLELGCCYNLAYVDPSIGKLQHLTYLSLFDGKMIKNLPGSLGNLHFLQELNLARTSIATLPDSICRLEKLERLNLQKCKSLGNFPQSLGNLRSLVNLNVEYTKIIRLPPSIGRLEKLKSMNLCGLAITMLPESYGDLRSLVHLNLSDSKISKLPDSIGRLENLEQLDLSWCEEIHALPGSLGQLKSLQKLDLSRSGISELPQCIVGLEKMEDLRLSGSKISQLPSTINQLSCLHILKLYECYQHRELPELPTSLTELRIKSHVLEKVPDLSNMKDLTSLEVICGAIMCWNGSFPSNLHKIDLKLLGISKLPDLSSCSLLSRLILRSLNSLEVVPNLSGLRKLVILEIESCKELTAIPGIGTLQSLYALCIRDCPSLVCLENLKDLQALREFKLVLCEKVMEISGLCELQGLAYLLIECCPSLVILENLRELKLLKQFRLLRCQNLIKIPGLGELQGLPYLTIKGCPSLVSLENLRELKALEGLVDCQMCIEIPGFGTFAGNGDKILELPSGFSDHVENLCDNFDIGNQTLYDELENLSIEEVNEEVTDTSMMIWPKKLQHHLHVHHLMPRLRSCYGCDCCRKVGKVWSYYCEECDFDLCCECAVLKKDITITSEQSSAIIPSGSYIP